MAVWANRSPGYKVGMVGIILFSALYVIGFASPVWIEEESSEATGNYWGLWMGCSYSTSFNYCGLLGLGKLAVWFHSARALSIVGCMLLLGTCIGGIVKNCCSAAPVHNRRLEVMGIIGGSLALIGALVFMGKYKDLLPFQFIGDKLELSWAFYLAAVGSAVAVVGSIIVAISNSPLDPAQGVPMSGVVLAPQPQPAGGPYTLYSGGVHQSPAAYPYMPPGPVYNVPLPGQPGKHPVG